MLGCGRAAAFGTVGRVDGRQEAAGRHRVKCGHWQMKENRRRFLEEFAVARGIGDRPEEWVGVTAADIVAHGGGGLLAMYKMSLFGLLTDNFPEKRWKSTDCGKRRPRGFWQSKENQKAFIEETAAKLGIESPYQWADVGVAQLQRLGGGALLNQHGGSLARLLRSVYGREENGEQTTVAVESCRTKMPNGYWQRRENVGRYLGRLAAILGVREREEWYRVSRAQMRLVKPSPPNGYALVDLLQVAFPSQQWDRSRAASAAKKASQRGLGLAVRYIFSTPACTNEEA